MSKLEPRPWIDPSDMPVGEGMVGVGGDLNPQTLLLAYSSGVFPWFEAGDPILWWSPDPRAIFEMDGLYRSKRLMRTVRSGKFTLTFNRAFPEVMDGCADREEGTWVTRSMRAAYVRLHEMGHAHWVETWIDGDLVGGAYGVAVGGLFAAESMFYREDDASKVALAGLFDRLNERGFVLFDTQMLTPHTTSMGAIEIPRSEYLARLAIAKQLQGIRFGD